MNPILKVLKNKNFLFLWIGQLISQFGDCLAAMALIGLVYDKYHSSTVEYAKLIFFVIIPVFLIGPVAGVYVDRWNRKRVMIICDIIRGLLVILIPVLMLIKANMIFVYLCVFLIYSSTRFFLPSKLAIIPDIVSKDKLLAANSLTTTTRTIALVFSFALAGVVVHLLSWRVSFFVDALTFFISAYLISRIEPKNVVEELKQDVDAARDMLKRAIKTNIFAEVKYGLMYILQNARIRQIALMFFMLMSGAGALSVVLIVFIQKNFGTGTWHLSFLASFLALGVLVGALIYARYGENLSEMKMILISFIVSGIFLAVFSKVIMTEPSLEQAGVLTVLLGVALSPIVIGLYTLLHHRIPNSLRGKIFSSIEMVIHAGFLIFMFFAAWVGAYVQELYIIITIGLAFTVAGVLGLTRMTIDTGEIT